MKIGWVSATPLAKTGYGTQTLEVVDRLLEYHDITCIGQTADTIVWGGRQTMTTPRGHKLDILPLVDWGSAASIIEQCYNLEYNFDVIVGFMDAFGIEYLNHLKLPVIGWIPIDGPFTAKWANYVRDFHKVVAYSHFGHRELMKHLLPSKVDYVGHGIPKEFKPMDTVEFREKIKRENDIPTDAFLVTNVGANVGMRKELPLMMKTFTRFVNDGHEDAHLYIHCNAYSAWPKGYDLLTWREMIGAQKNIHFPQFDTILVPVSNEELALWYSASDIYWQNSVAEGFGLPIGEAMACGTTVMVPDNSAQVEFVVDEEGMESRGWIIDSLPEDVYEQIPVYIPQLPNYPVPNQRSAVQILNIAYDNPDILKEKADNAQQFIEDYYRWDTIITGWLRVLKDVEQDIEILKRLKTSFVPAKPETTAMKSPP